MRVTFSLRFFVLASAFLLNACGGKVDAPGAATSGPSGRLTPALPVTPYVVHTNEGLGVPSFAWIGNQAVGPLKLPKNATPVDVAWGTLNAVAPSYKMSPAALAGAHIGAMHDIGRGGLIARFDQSVDGIDVFGSSMNVAMKSDMQPIAVTGSLAPSTKVLSAKGWTLDARAAVAAAFNAMTGSSITGGSLASNGTDEAGHDRFDFSVRSVAAVQYAHARVKRVWYPQQSGIVPSWYVEIDLGGSRGVEARNNSYVIHGNKGTTLFENDLMAFDSYKYRVWADNTGPKGLAPMDSPYGNGLTPNVPGAFDPNAVAPPFVFPSLVTLQNIPFSMNDPWLPPAATQLNGNNAWAYADLVAPDGYTPMSADLTVPPTSAGVFDRIYDPATLPGESTANIQATTTNLFFVVNYMHDLFYDSGWNEAARNPQNNNFGRGGVGGDQIHAESQDNSGLDNANASTGADGNSPRIQMYLWDLIIDQKLTANTPPAVAGEYVAVASGFGPPSFNFTKDVVRWVDVTGGASLGCTAGGGPMNPTSITGKIVIIDRGTCNFTEKATNAKAAGAYAMLLNNATNGAMQNGFGGAFAGLEDFTAMMVAKADGDALIAQAANGLNMTFYKSPPHRDGSLDGIIMSHEWGHILSNRLIGNANGLTNNQGRSMGEGWSDFVALLTYIRPTDLAVPSNANWNGAYPTGTFALGGSPADIYYGIRRYPYSFDMTNHNPLTFKHITNGVVLPTSPPPIFGANGATNSEVHNSGEVWAQMMWDCYVGLLRDTANYTFATGSQAMRDYLVASLKLTPNAPTYTEARDAWLAAAAANSAKPGDLLTFATAFARRGLGTGAVAPGRTSTTHAGAVESFITGADAAFISATLDDNVTSCDKDHILDTNEVGTVTVTVRNTGVTTLSATTVTLSSTNTNITFPGAGGATANVPSVAPFSNAQVQIQIGMAAAVTTLQAYDLTVTITDASFVNTPTRAATLNFQGNYDWAPATSATDDANALTSLWTTGADPALFTGLPWVRITTPGQTFGGTWFGQNPATTADTYLVSPPLHVGAGNFSFTFKHGYSFEKDATPTYYDGGVVELSTNGGASWTDLGSAFTMNGYTVTLYDGMDPNLGPSENPLKGRMAFGGGPTAGFPALISSTVNLATTYANSTVRIRFRIGSDQGSAATGWLVDDIAFTGLTDTPFTTQVDQRNLCSNNPPVANAGPAQMVNEGTVVTLDGSGSADPDAADVLSYHWTQLSGPTAVLSNPSAAKPTFTAPLVPADTVLRFQLVVDDGKVFSTPSTVDITDKDIPAPPPDMTTPPDMVTPNDLSTLPPVDMAMKADMATTPADLAEPEDMTPAPLPPDMAKKGGGGGGCSTTGDNTPASTALPLFGLVVLGFAFRRRTRRS